MKKKIAVVMGGYSSEYAISLKSGEVVCQHLNKDKYEIFPVHILKDKWIYLDENDTEHPINMADFTTNINYNIATGRPYTVADEDGVLSEETNSELQPYTETADLTVRKNFTFGERKRLSLYMTIDL